MDEKSNKSRAADIPIIKLFTHHEWYYFYDTYTNSFFNVTKGQYKELSILIKIGVAAYRAEKRQNKEYVDIILLLDKGLLKYDFIEKIEHPETKNIICLTERCVHDMILQVTQDCNFRCRYCLYAGKNDVERHHEKMQMTWKTAKQAVDFLFDHSVDVEEINIFFYGGEPLLNFKLIEQVVLYTEERFQTKKVGFHLTINGSLLNEQIGDFFAKYHVEVSISLDGPREIQNRHRKWSATGGDTYDVVMKNVNRLKEKHPEYFEQSVSFLPVFMEDEDCKTILKFYRELGIDDDKVKLLQANLNGVDYEYNLYRLGRLKKIGYGITETFDESDFEKIKNKLHMKGVLPKIWHHSGQCIPGVHRVFVDAKGMLFPCEKITEDKTFSIGSLNDGFDNKKISNFLNVGKLTEEECKKCWAIRHCEMCISLCNDIDMHQITREQKLHYCEEQKKRCLALMKYYLETIKNEGK